MATTPRAGDERRLSTQRLGTGAALAVATVPVLAWYAAAALADPDAAGRSALRALLATAL